MYEIQVRTGSPVRFDRVKILQITLRALAKEKAPERREGSES